MLMRQRFAAATCGGEFQQRSGKPAASCALSRNLSIVFPHSKHRLDSGTGPRKAAELVSEQIQGDIEYWMINV